MVDSPDGQPANSSYAAAAGQETHHFRSPQQNPSAAAEQAIRIESILDDTPKIDQSKQQGFTEAENPASMINRDAKVRSSATAVPTVQITANPRVLHSASSSNILTIHSRSAGSKKTCKRGRVSQLTAPITSVAAGGIGTTQDGCGGTLSRSSLHHLAVNKSNPHYHKPSLSAKKEGSPRLILRDSAPLASAINSAHVSLPLGKQGASQAHLPLFQQRPSQAVLVDESGATRGDNTKQQSVPRVRQEDDEDPLFLGEESENIIDDPETCQELEFSSIRFSHEKPNKPAANDGGATHIYNVTRLKPRSIESMLNAVHAGFPEEHSDEIGPSTHRDLAAKQNDDLEYIMARLVNDKDAVTREARLSNNVSSLRPKTISDYFGNTDTDERSNLMIKHETKVTKVRNTMAPTTSAQQLGLSHSSQQRLIAAAPSKTPTLYAQKKRSQPFLKSEHLQLRCTHLTDDQQEEEQASQNDGPSSYQKDSMNSNLVGGAQQIELLQNYATSKAAVDSNRSRTAFHNRLNKQNGLISQTQDGSGRANRRTGNNAVLDSHTYGAMIKGPGPHGYGGKAMASSNSSAVLNYGSQASQLRVPSSQERSSLVTVEHQQLRGHSKSSSIVRVCEDCSPSKSGKNRTGSGSILSRQSILGQNYGVMQDTSINRTAEQSSRKSQNQVLSIDDTTQKINFKEMFTSKPSTTNSAYHVSMLNQVSSSSPLKAQHPKKGRNHMNVLGDQQKHTRNNSSVINQSIQIIQSLTAGFFGKTQDNTTQGEEGQEEESKRDADGDDVESNLYCETEHNAFDNKMHPTKLVEKNWVDSYKLAQLIEQQDKWLHDPQKKAIFGGIQHMQLDQAFAIVRSNSSAGYKSPKGAISRGSIQTMRQMVLASDNHSSLPRALSSQRINLSTYEGSRDPQYQSIRQMDQAPSLHQACFIEIDQNDSQKSHQSQLGGADEDSLSSNRSERFVEQFLKTQNRQGLHGGSEKKGHKTNILLDRVQQKTAAKLEQTMTTERQSYRQQSTVTMTTHQETHRPQQLAQGLPVAQTQAMLMTQATEDLAQTQDSVQIPRPSHQSNAQTTNYDSTDRQSNQIQPKQAIVNQHKLKVPLRQVGLVSTTGGSTDRLPLSNQSHQIKAPYQDLQSFMKRDASANELHTSSINNSNVLDPDMWCLSNTSMSQLTQSQVQGAETDRFNLLKDSHITLQEDSTTVMNDADDPKAIAMSKQNHEILSRQMMHRPDILAGEETPQQKHILNSQQKQSQMQPYADIQQPTSFQSVQHHAKKRSNDFIKCTDDFKIDAQNSSEQSSLPAKSKSQVTRDSGAKVRSQRTGGPSPSTFTAQKYRFVTGGVQGNNHSSSQHLYASGGNQRRKRSAGKKSIEPQPNKSQSVSSHLAVQKSTMTSVQDSIAKANTMMMTRLNLSSIVQPPQIIPSSTTATSSIVVAQTRKNNASVTNLALGSSGLNRSLAEANLTQQNTSFISGPSKIGIGITASSTRVAAGRKRQNSRPLDTSAITTFTQEGMNSIAHKVDRLKFSASERQSVASSAATKSHTKTAVTCRQKKSITTSHLVPGGSRAVGVHSDRKQHNFKQAILHQSHDNFNSMSGGHRGAPSTASVSQSMEFASSSGGASHTTGHHQRGQTTSASSTVVTLKSAASSRLGGHVQSSNNNLSSGKRQVVGGSGWSNSANVSASGKPVIPRTPQTSNKLKGLSAKKQWSVCSSSAAAFLDETSTSVVSFSHKFEGKRKSTRPQHQQSTSLAPAASSVGHLNAVNQSINFDSTAQRRTKLKNFGSPGPTASSLANQFNSHRGSAQAFDEQMLQKRIASDHMSYVSSQAACSFASLAAQKKLQKSSQVASARQNPPTNGSQSVVFHPQQPTLVPFSIQQAEAASKEIRQRARYKNLAASESQKAFHSVQSADKQRPGAHGDK